MMKHFRILKKASFAVTAAFVLLLTAANSSGKVTTLPTTTIEDPTGKPVIRPMNDDLQDGHKDAPEI